MATTYRVSNAVQLAAAIKSVKGGETILLAAGNYGNVVINSRNLASTVTIKSADPAHDAVFSGLRINVSSGFRFEDIDLHRALLPGEPIYTQAAYISASSRIAIIGMGFSGSLDGNAANDGTGLRIDGGSAISVTGSTFTQWTHAATFTNVNGLVVEGNDFSGAVRALDLTGLQNASFIGNHFVGVAPAWNTAAFVGKNVVVQDNVVEGVGFVAKADAGQVINVANAAELATAIKTVTGGETILLAAGDYGDVRIVSRNLASQVTIKSADSAHDASFSGLRMNLSSNFRFEDIDVHRPLAKGEAEFTTAVDISNGSKIDLVGIDFTGSLDGNSWNDGVGLRFSGVTDSSLVGSTFDEWTNAAVFSQDSGLLISGNTVTHVREGFDFTAVTDVAVIGNRLIDFTPNFTAGDHADAIQFWTTGTNVGSSDVVIRDNVILQGKADVHGIFISGTGGYRFDDFTIENNFYYGGSRHGISVGGVDNSEVTGNTVISAPGGSLEAGINISDSNNVVATNNISPLLLIGGVNMGLVTRANIDIYDQAQKKGLSLSQLFEAPGNGAIDVGSFVVKNGSAAAVADAGFHSVQGSGASNFDFAAMASHSSIHAYLGTSLQVA